MPLHLFKERNFNLVTIVGLIIGIAMFGALAYLPTYLQMVTGANATEAGLLMIPLMAALLITSVALGTAGQQDRTVQGAAHDRHGAGRGLAVPAVHHDPRSWRSG